MRARPAARRAPATGQPGSVGRASSCRCCLTRGGGAAHPGRSTRCHRAKAGCHRFAGRLLPQASSGSTDWMITAVAWLDPAASATRLGKPTVAAATPIQPRRTAPKLRSWPTTNDDGIGRDREAHALRSADHRGVDPDQLPCRGGERTARAARVERRVGLDHVLDRPAQSGSAGCGRARTRRRPSPSPRSPAEPRSRSQADPA